MSDAARRAVLEAHCRELKLPTVRRQYPELVRQAAHDGWDYEEFLLQLLEAEVLVRRDGAVARLLRGARFPGHKTLDQLDWDALRGVAMPPDGSLRFARLSSAIRATASCPRGGSSSSSFA